MKKAQILLIWLIGACPVWAAPDLSGFVDVNAVRVYEDNQKPGRFYLSPPAPRLNTENGPGYGLDVFRYVGTKATSDQNAFRIRGVLSLSLERKRDPAEISRIRRELLFKGRKPSQMTSMPVKQTTVRLLYGGQEMRWEYESRWTPKEVRLPLDKVLSEILFEALEAGQTQISLVLEEALSGVRLSDDGWKQQTTRLSRTLSLTMDMSAHPDAFAKIDLGAQQTRAYTGLDVFCFDFIEGLTKDLYLKQVEVAIPTPGRDLVKKVEFREGGDYRARIQFDLSRDLDQPYRYRVTRILTDGTRRVAPWQEKYGDTLLDVTAYQNEEAPPDPHQKPSARMQ